ncbi:hypothetical protein BI347_18905 [Chromobacterium sphagni]|uniref:Uncharacterized protein n=1 Tax=Chromobacterium sphagni TaxID=1903179 RepID=A0A1S1WWY2_9NEIS|nr:hypothetical protein BI347_18905 [Chromobacterium sphagni]
MARRQPYVVSAIKARRGHLDYFHGLSKNGSPQWGAHWEPGGSKAGMGGVNGVAAPLPLYQRQYARTRYPRTEQQQQAIRRQNEHPPPRVAAPPQRA